MALAVAPSARAATIVIDDFMTSQSAVATAGSPIASSSIAAPEALGGERDMLVDLISGPTALSLSVNPFGGELLIHDSGAAVQGSSMTVWDGMDGDPTAIDPTGLGGVDITGGGLNDALRLSYVLADLTGVVTLTVYDASDASGATWSRAIVNLPGGIFAPVDIDVPFTDFSTVGVNGAASFSNVGAISLQIANTSTGSLDVLLSRISTVPEPATGLLVLCGLVGAIGVANTRRNK